MKEHEHKSTISSAFSSNTLDFVAIYSYNYQLHRSSVLFYRTFTLNLCDVLPELRNNPSSKEVVLKNK
jgi:hypothetical protein